jgi:hypothetical protein
MLSSPPSSKRRRLFSTTIIVKDHVSTVQHDEVSPSQIKKGIVTVTFTGKHYLTIEIDTTALLNNSTFAYSPDLKECLDAYWPLPCPMPPLLSVAKTARVPKKYAVRGLQSYDLAAASAIADKLRTPPTHYEDPYLLVHCTEDGYIANSKNLTAAVPPSPTSLDFNGCVYMDNFEEEMEISTVLVALEKIKPPTGPPMAVVVQRNCRIEEWLENIERCYPTWETRVLRDAASLVSLMQNLATTDLNVFHVRIFHVRTAFF